MTDPEFRPSAAAYRRAAAAGHDLEALRHSDPQVFRMFSAEEICLTSQSLERAVGDAFFALFPDREIYRMPDAVPSRVRLLAFPPLDRKALTHWDERLALVPSQWPELPVYNRVVEDVRGTRRELALPLDPKEWNGQPVVVGPFDTDVEAADFGHSVIAGTTLGFDVFPLGESWICDLFLADDPDLLGR